MRRAPARAVGPLALALALALGACARDAERRWPSGALVVARTQSLARLAAQLERLGPSPLARRAAALAAALPECPEVEARAESGALLDALAALRCRPERSALDALDAARGARDLAFALPLESGGHLLGALRSDAGGGVELELHLPRDAFAGDARALLLPGADPTGPPLLSDAQSLVHARVRPDAGLDVARWVSADGQASQLFRLKSALFAGAVLDGTWEAAIYLPSPSGSLPRAALALGFQHRAAAVAAMERFVAELRETWPVQRSPFSLGGREGACLLDLRVLPELAPCYVATDRALVVGWNADSVRRALDGEPSGDADAPGALRIDLDRVAEADARLGGDGPAAARSGPWRRLVARGAREGERVLVRVRLDPA